MLAMHYRFTLKDQDQVAAIRRRAVERGPLFDLVPGLAHKWFLLDPRDPCYALIYLWRRPEAALAFLEGELFAALSAAFGRPEVRLLLPVAINLPTDEPATAYLAEDAPALRLLDPRDSSRLALGFGHGPGRQFEVAYHARGAA